MAIVILIPQSTAICKWNWQETDSMHSNAMSLDSGHEGSRIDSSFSLILSAVFWIWDTHLPVSITSFSSFFTIWRGMLRKAQGSPVQSKSINWTYPMIEVSSSKNLVGWHLWALILQPCSLEPSSLTSWPRREWFWQDFFSIEIIYSCLPQPYGMVSQKALTFLKFDPASLQSAIQLLNVLAMETLNQYQSCQSKKELHFGDLNLQPSKLQSSTLTSQPW